MADHPCFPRSGDDDDFTVEFRLEFRLEFGGLGHASTLDTGGKAAVPLNKEPVGFLHFKDPEVPKRKRRGRK